MKGCVKMADENQKKSFIVYFDWGEALSYFSNEEVGEIFRAVFSYAKDGTEPEFSQNTLNGVFTFMKSALDRDREAYEAKCKTNQINGRKGGRPKKRMVLKKTQKNRTVILKNPKNPIMTIIMIMIMKTIMVLKKTMSMIMTMNFFMKVSLQKKKHSEHFKTFS